MTTMTRARIWDGSIPGTHEPGFAEPTLIQHPTPTKLADLLHGAEDVFYFEFGEATVILSRQDDGRGMRWHLSVSCPDRHPTWDEIKTARYRLLGPDVVMAMILPRADDYVNVARQDHVFQLWQLIEEEADGW